VKFRREMNGEIAKVLTQLLAKAPNVEIRERIALIIYFAPKNYCP